MNKALTFLALSISFFMTSCNDDDVNIISNTTPSARIDKIVFTEIPIFTTSKPSDFDYFSLVTDFNSDLNHPNEIIDLKDELIYNESTGLVNDLTFTYNDYIIPSNSGVPLQASPLIGSSSTNYTNDFDYLTNLTLTEIYQFDNAETFEKSYTVEIDSSNTLIDNSEGPYSFTVYGTFIYD